MGWATEASRIKISLRLKVAGTNHPAPTTPTIATGKAAATSAMRHMVEVEATVTATTTITGTIQAAAKARQRVKRGISSCSRTLRVTRQIMQAPHSNTYSRCRVLRTKRPAEQPRRLKTTQATMRITMASRPHMDKVQAPSNTTDSNKHTAITTPTSSIITTITSNSSSSNRQRSTIRLRRRRRGRKLAMQTERRPRRALTEVTTQSSIK